MRPSLRLAVALKYQHQQDVAPLVVAAGRDATADALVEGARDLGIPVHADAPLAQSLSAVPVGAFIPEELYPVVAQVLALVYAMDRQVGLAAQGSAPPEAGADAPGNFPHPRAPGLEARI